MNICAVCGQRTDRHSLAQALICNQKFQEIQFERLANKLCISCGCPSDILDPVSNEYWCNGCLMWETQRNG